MTRTARHTTVKHLRVPIPHTLRLWHAATRARQWPGDRRAADGGAGGGAKDARRRRLGAVRGAWRSAGRHATARVCTISSRPISLWYQLYPAHPRAWWGCVQPIASCRSRAYASLHRTLARCGNLRRSSNESNTPLYEKGGETWHPRLLDAYALDSKIKHKYLIPYGLHDLGIIITLSHTRLLFFFLFTQNRIEPGRQCLGEDPAPGLADAELTARVPM